MKEVEKYLYIQLGVYGAVADLCEEFIPPLASTVKLVAVEKSESLLSPADLLNIQRLLVNNEQAPGNLLQNHKERVENLLDDDQLIKSCPDAGVTKTVEIGQYFMTKDAEEFSRSESLEKVMSQFLHTNKIEYAGTISFQLRTAAEPTSIKRQDGKFGRLPLQAHQVGGSHLSGTGMNNDGYRILFSKNLLQVSFTVDDDPM